MSFEAEVSEFLEALDNGTRHIYACGLKAFREYYAPRGSITDFLNRVEEDARKPRLQRKHEARNSLRMFVDWLQRKGCSPKTVRAYVAAVQSLCRYHELNVSTRYLKMPSDKPVSRKKAWTTEEAAKFVSMIKKPVYRAIATIAFQSGLGLGDILALRYSDVKDEFEKGVVPLCLDLSRIKTNVPHLTFIGEWAFSMLRQHLEGKTLSEQDKLFNVTPRAVDRYFQRVARKFVGEYEGFNPCRIHSLRAAFRTILADAGMPVDEIEFFMGHQLPEQRRVYMSRTRDGWRELYKSYEWALTPKNP